MLQEKEGFISLALSCKALQWGAFKLKSGRISPYFFNAGMFYQNSALHQLGELYAALILKHNLDVQHLFGPAYKGIPLATAAAIALAAQHKTVTLTFNRKEPKDHGEGGMLIGAPLAEGNTIMVDDVITAGTAFRESKTLIEHNGGHLIAILIMLNRCEKGATTQSTVQEIEALGIKVYPIVTFFDLVEYLELKQQYELVDKLKEYHAEYGARLT